ncbi:hypothetical protein LRS10_05055 [Phenylobacterium sp. J426]|nr:hypothetical protein [Phenylobacterium sp. J426]MCR5873598.1 hypothetical protein [Phenylobacterium sp. J426]
MTGTTPSISIASVPGGQIGVSEAGLPNGSQAGQVSTSGSWTFTIAAPDGVGDLTVGGYRAIADGVFTAGSIAFGPGVLSVTAYNAADGSVTAAFQITTPYQSPHAGPQQRYGDFLSAPIILTDRDGDRAEASLGIQIRDDEALVLSQDSATVQAGRAVTGNVITDGTPDRFTADGFGSVTRAGTDTAAAPVAMPDRGVATVEGAYGVLTLDRWGGYTYTANADAPAGAVDHLRYWASDGDGDEASSWLHITIQAGGSSPTEGRMVNSPGPNSNVVGSAGADTITASQGGDTITTGAGADVIVMYTTPWSPHVVKDFTLGADTLDLRPLDAYLGSDPVGDKYIVFLDDGAGGTKVLYDSDGAGAGQQWPSYILHLQGVSSQGLTWRQLTGEAGGGGGDDGGGNDGGSGQTIVASGPNSTLAGGGWGRHDHREPRRRRHHRRRRFRPLRLRHQPLVATRGEGLPRRRGQVDALGAAAGRRLHRLRSGRGQIRLAAGRRRGRPQPALRFWMARARARNGRTSS